MTSPSESGQNDSPGLQAEAWSPGAGQPDPTTAVILMAYGTPRSRAEIEPYYTDIRRGRPPTPELLADLAARYEAIGGLSPLAERTEAQRAGLQVALDARQPGRFEVVLGLKHAEPKIEAAVHHAVARGRREVIGLVLAPHYSAFSIGQYLGRMRAATTNEPGDADSAASATSGAATADVETAGVVTAGVESWATEPAFIAFLAADVRRRLALMPAGTLVMFTAHSLPVRIIESGDPYADELRATAEAVAAAAGLGDGDWQIAWQSAGRTPEPWIGPDILDALDAVAAERGAGTGVLVCACGFVADHLEVLYDLDIEAARRAELLGLVFDRTSCVNAETAVLGALADRIVVLAS